MTTFEAEALKVGLQYDSIRHKGLTQNRSRVQSNIVNPPLALVVSQFIYYNRWEIE